MRRLASPAKNESLELKKHIGLIHSTNKLTLLERKIANALLFNAYDSLMTASEHRIHVSDLAKLIGYNSNDYKTIKNSLMSLMSTVLEWNILDQDSKGNKNAWVASTMLADAKIEGPLCTYSYSNRMRELCYHPEFYGRLNIKELSSFKSTYGIALYENCVRYKNIPQTPWFDLSIFRKLMGVEDGKYEKFRDLNSRVISPAVKEVNAYSTVQVKPEFEKAGRVVSRIKFLINNESDKDASEVIEKNPDNNSVTDKLINHYGFSITQVAQLLNDYSETYLLQKIVLVESSKSYQSGKIEHLAKYLEKALKEDFQAPKSSKVILDDSVKSRQKNSDDKKLLEKKKEAYALYQRKTILDSFEGLADKIKQDIDKNFEKTIKETAYYKAYVTKGGIKDPLVCDRFVEFVKINYMSILNCPMSFSEFCK